MPYYTRRAFTMVELTFVIVIIGILSAIAVPKFKNTVDEAYISKAESVVSTLRSAIATERQKKILKGEAPDINTTGAAALLDYGLDSNWAKTDADTFTYTVPGGTATCDFDIVGAKLERKTCSPATGLANL